MKEIIKGIIKESDIEQIYSMEMRVFKDSALSLKELIDMNENELYEFKTLYRDEKLAGYIIMYRTPDVDEIMKIAVEEDYRNKGIGNELLDYFTDKKIFLEVRETNINAIQFYEKNGFKTINTRKNYYKNTGEDALIMMKDPNEKI